MEHQLHDLAGDEQVIEMKNGLGLEGNNPAPSLVAESRTKTMSPFKEQTYGYRGEWGRAGINWETGIDIYILLYIK